MVMIMSNNQKSLLRALILFYLMMVLCGCPPVGLAPPPPFETIRCSDGRRITVPTKYSEIDLTAYYWTLDLLYARLNYLHRDDKELNEHHNFNKIKNELEKQKHITQKTLEKITYRFRRNPCNEVRYAKYIAFKKNVMEYCNFFQRVDTDSLKENYTQEIILQRIEMLNEFLDEIMKR